MEIKYKVKRNKMAVFRKSLEVRWSDVDSNSHVTHTAYAAFATHTRVTWMSNIGFSFNKLMGLGYTGVLLKEETEYYRELFLGDVVEVELSILGESVDHSRWKFLHNIYTPKGKLSAKHIIYGAWINLQTRKISPPPAEFIAILEKLPKDEPFEVLGTAFR